MSRIGAQPYKNRQINYIFAEKSSRHTNVKYWCIPPKDAIQKKLCLRGARNLHEDVFRFKI